MLTEGVALEIIRAAREAGAHVIVDPKGGDHIRYRGADLLKPNRRELAHATGMPVATDDEIVAASRALIETVRFRRGPSVARRRGLGAGRGRRRRAYPARRSPRGLRRIGRRRHHRRCGGGGARCRQRKLTEAARLANIAAGIVVGKIGTAVVYASELTAALNGRDLHAADKVVPRSHALDLVARWRRHGLKIGFTNGCFDLLHPGHVALLGQAKAACDRLVVGLNSDASTARLKGPRRPIQSESERAAVLASLAAVDLIVIFEEDTPIELIRDIRPQVLVKGADYRLDEVVGGEFVKNAGGEVLLARIVPGYSTTATIAAPRQLTAWGSHRVRHPASGSSWRRSRAAAMRAKRKVSARRRAGLSGVALAVAQHGRAERIRHHQATFLWDQRSREVIRDSEIKAVREVAVGCPFAVGTEIGQRALDLDDHELAGSCRGREYRRAGHWRAGTRPGSHSRAARAHGRRRAPEARRRVGSAANADMTCRRIIDRIIRQGERRRR